MQRRTVLTVAPAAWALALQARAQALPPAQPGQAVAWPDVRLLGGGRWPAAQWAGQAAVVVFWSTTCPFCKRHNQHVEKLYRAAQVSAGGGRSLQVLAVAREQDAAAVRRYAAQQGYSFPISLDNGPMSAALSTRRVIPLTVTVDRQGRLLQAMAGEMFEEDVMELLQLAQAPLEQVPTKPGR